MAAVWLPEPDGSFVARAVAARGALAAEVEGFRADSREAAAQLLREPSAPRRSSLSLPLDAADGDSGALELVRASGSLRAARPSASRCSRPISQGSQSRLCARRAAAGLDGGRALDVAGDALAVGLRGRARDRAHRAPRGRSPPARTERSSGAFAARSSIRSARPGRWSRTPSSSAPRARSWTTRARPRCTAIPPSGVRRHAAARPAAARGAAAALPPPAHPRRPRPRAAGELRRPRRARTALDRARAQSRTRAGTEPRAPLGRGRGDRPPLAVAHARDGDRARRGAARHGPRGRLPARGRAVVIAASREIDGPHDQIAGALLDLVVNARLGGAVVEIDDIGDGRAARGRARSRRASRHRPRARAAARRRRRADRAARGLSGAAAEAHGERVGAAARARRPARRRRPERAAAREREAAGAELEAALASEREKSNRLSAQYDISRSFAQTLSLDTTLRVLAESIVTLLGVDAAVIRMPDERGELVARCVEVNDERVDAAARALLHRPQRLPRRELLALLERKEPLVLDAERAEELGDALALLAPFLAQGLERRADPDRDAGGAAGDADDHLAAPRPSGRGRDRRDGALDRRPGRARDRQRPAVRPAEGLRGRDAALAAAVRAAGAAGPRARRRLRVVRAGRGGRRRLRLPHAGRRPARRRARRRHGPRRRRDGRHGDGEVRLPLARPRPPRPGRVPGRRERGRLLGDRDREVHHDGRARDRRREAARSRAPAAGTRRRGSCCRTGRSRRSPPAASRSASTRRRRTRRCALRSRPARSSSPTRTASSRRGEAASCSASSVSTHCSPSGGSCRRSRSRRRRSPRAASGRTASSTDDFAVVVIKRAE